MRYIVEGDIPAFCDWLDVKLEGPGHVLSPVFVAETLTADLLVETGPDRLLHVEYIRTPKSDMFARMVSYRGHIMLRHPGRSIAQYAIVLGSGHLRSWDDPENGFTLGLHTIYLPQTDPDEFLTRPGLAALAHLAKGDQQTKARSVAAAFNLLGTVPAKRQALLSAMLNLGTISLAPSTIDLIRREINMTIETVAAFYRQTEIGQELIEEGREEGREETIADLLHSRFGEDPRIPELATRLALGSGVEVMRAITEAPALNDLLDPIPPVRPASS